MSRGSAFGAAKEREVGEMIEAEGWVVFRSAGSQGPADLTCLKAGEMPMLVQVKGGAGNLFKGFPPAERIALKVAGRRAGADVFLCRWVETDRAWVFIPPEDWPTDQPARHAPDYYVDRETDCWIWAKAVQVDGYGIARRDRRSWLAHRYYYEKHVGPVPDGLQLDHLCRVRACVNPAHLEPVTQDENRLRGRLTKLTPSQVRAIRESAEHPRVLADRYGIGSGYVYRIRSGDARKDVPMPLLRGVVAA